VSLDAFETGPGRQFRFAPSLRRPWLGCVRTVAQQRTQPEGSTRPEAAAYDARRSKSGGHFVADKYPFLSDGWFDAASKLIEEHGAEAPPGTSLVMNLEVANGDETVEFHMGSKDGQTMFGKGKADGADVTLSTDMDTAKAVFVSGDQQAGMQAFMSGKVRVQGDMTKMMMAQAGGGGGSTPALTEALQAITE
jgi:putative sterol carrier protein